MEGKKGVPQSRSNGIKVRVQQTRRGWAPVVDAAGFAFISDFDISRRDAAQELADILSGKSHQDFATMVIADGVSISVSTEKGEHTFSAKVPGWRINRVLSMFSQQAASTATAG